MRSLDKYFFWNLPNQLFLTNYRNLFHYFFILVCNDYLITILDNINNFNLRYLNLYWNLFSNINYLLLLNYIVHYFFNLAVLRLLYNIWYSHLHLLYLLSSLINIVRNLNPSLDLDILNTPNCHQLIHLHSLYILYYSLSLNLLHNLFSIIHWHWFLTHYWALNWWLNNSLNHNLFYDLSRDCFLAFKVYRNIINECTINWTININWNLLIDSNNFNFCLLNYNWWLSIDRYTFFKNFSLVNRLLYNYWNLDIFRWWSE